jgi:hypothetical protein
MLIKFATILLENSEKAMTVAKQLETAVQEGDMLKVDLLSEELEALTDKDNSIYIEEDYWHRFVSSVRDNITDFKTSYLLDVVHFKDILNLGIGKEFSDITAILHRAAEIDCLVLQLPIGETGQDV